MMMAGLVALASCAPTPSSQVTASVARTDRGRQVVAYRICQKDKLNPLSRRTCRTKTEIQNYCYQTLGDVECYDQPVPGRATTSGSD